MRRPIEFTVNDEPRSVVVHPLARLLDVLRENFGLTGTKEGCGEGECGACSVLVNRQLVNSCLVPVLQVAGANVRTIEGIASNEQLSRVQQAFLETGGAQCGICTPGMIMAATCIKHSGDASIRDGLAGNLCRCTGYTRIFEAVRRAMENA